MNEDYRDLGELSERELLLRRELGLSDAQLLWRRWCIAANCGGDEEVFCQEYPTTAEEAFVASGRPVFAARQLGAALHQSKAAEVGGLALHDNGNLEFAPGEGRFLRLYQPPQRGHEYIIGCDVAAGYRGGDYSAMCVLERERLEVVACWHGHMEPELFGEQALLLARWYNRALLVPEANNHGIAVLGVLKRANYGHVWRRPGGEAGFLTTQTSKAKMIAALAAYIRAGAERIRDAETLRECLSYAYDDKGHANAMAGAHDDRVIALALAVWVAAERPQGPKIDQIDVYEAYGAYPSTGY